MKDDIIVVNGKRFVMTKIKYIIIKLDLMMIKFENKMAVWAERIF